MKTRVFCPACGGQTSEEADPCPSCGRSNEEGRRTVREARAVYCPGCGKRIPRESGYCPDCGTTLADLPAWARWKV